MCRRHFSDASTRRIIPLSRGTGDHDEIGLLCMMFDKGSSRFAIAPVERNSFWAYPKISGDLIRIRDDVDFSENSVTHKACSQSHSVPWLFSNFPVAAGRL